MDPEDKPAPENPSPEDLLAELDFGPPRILGNLAKEATNGIHVRDLTEGDIQALDGPRGANLPKMIQKLRSSHHALARCLATGMKPVQASLVTGYTQNRICLLQQDPSFRALMEEYKAEAREVFADRTGHGPGQEVKLTVAPSMIDRPPKETYEEWQARRARELSPGDQEVTVGLSSLVPTTRTPN